MSRQMETQLFNLKFASKQLQRASKKASKAERQEKAKLKKAIEAGNIDGARIYASNAIREKNQALNFLRLSSRIDGVASRVEGALRMNDLTKNMVGVVKGMDKVLGSMDTEKISNVLDKFESQFDTMDVRSSYMESAMASSTASATPQGEVDGLIQEVADEHGLEVAGSIQSAPQGEVAVAAPAPAAPVEDDLANRLAALRK